MPRPNVDPEAYLKNWVPIDAKDYVDFVETHWANDQLAPILEPDKPPVDRFLSITQTDVLDLIKAYPSDGSFFLRQEYRLFIDRLRKAWEEKGTTGMHGCLLLGQPAIGKTCFLLFFLIHCLSRQETVLFTTSSGKTFLFHSQGVSTIKTSDFTACLHLPPRDYNPGPFWSLVDCPDKKEPIASSVTYGTRRLFFVVAVSPDESRYKLMAERPTIRSYWMSRWSAEELVALWTRSRPTNIAPEQTKRYNLHPGRAFDLSTVNSLISDVGPCPQDILSHLRSPDNHRESVDRAIGHYTSDIFSIDHLLSHPDALSNQHSHKIVLVSRVGGTAGQDTLEVDVDDRFIVRFKTLDIFKMLHTHLLSIEVDATRALFMICKGLGPGSGTIFASFLFEGLAILFTRGLIPLNSDHPAFHPLILMDPVDPPSPPQKAKPPRAQKAKTTYRFVYTVQGQQHDLKSELSQLTFESHDDSKKMTRTRTALRRQPDQSTSSSKGKARQESPPAPPPYPWVHRYYVAFNKIQLLPRIDTNSYYCPIQTNYPLFDALFAERPEKDQVILWVLQMTIRREHGGVRSGFVILRDLKARIEAESPGVTVKFKYVLVVANDTSAPFDVVEWHFSEEFMECAGDVYIQFLDISTIPMDDLTLDDIIGTCEPDEGQKDDTTTIPLPESSTGNTMAGSSTGNAMAGSSTGLETRSRAAKRKASGQPATGQPAKKAQKQADKGKAKAT